MDFLTALRIMLRRWYVVELFLVLTILATWQVGTKVQATYQAQGKLLMLAPASEESNPFLELGGVAKAAEVISTALLSNQKIEELKATGLDCEYDLGTGNAGGGP